MSDIIARSQRSSKVTEDDSLAAWQRVWQALRALSGLILSDLNDEARKRIEVELVAINRTSARYDIELESDYEKLTDADAAEILSRIRAITQLCIDSEAERVMHDLDTAGRKLPIAAIGEVREHRDIFAPLLIQSLERTTAKARNGEEQFGDASLFAVLLLTELEVDEALPRLLDILRLPGELPLEILGDVIHELIPAILTQFWKGDIDSLGEMVRDRNTNLYVRWAASQVYKYFARDNLISRQVAVEALHRHFQDCVENKDDEMLAPLACELGDLAADTALETIRSAYECNLIDESIVDFEFIESQIAAGEATVIQEFEYCRPTGIPDTIAELRCWAAFQEAPSRPRRTPKSVPSRPPLTSPPLEKSSRAEPVTTIRFDTKVGRNDPCPCGSGKKFKKCCRQAQQPL